jgi:stage V sporulation protein G
MNDTKDTARAATTSLKIDARVTPISPKDNLIGFANLIIEDCLVIEGLKVCSGDKGIYVNMPSSQGKDGQWRDVVKPITADFRAQLTEAVRAEYGAAIERMQATVEAAKAVSAPGVARDGKEAERPADKPSALEALKSGKEQAKAQPVKAASGKEDKSL